jgi:hypothetical protein
MNTYSVSVVGGDLALTNDFAVGSFTRMNALPVETGDDYEDFDISLLSLADNILAPGKSITFELSLNADAAGGRFFVDNVAILGSPHVKDATLKLLIIH